MDTYQSIIDYLLTFPIFNTWNEMRMILQHAVSTRPRDWQLPVIARQAVGKHAEKAIPASAAFACAQISIILVDDMLDEDQRGEYRRIGNGRASNLAIAFQSASIETLIRSDVNPLVRLKTLSNLNRMMLTTADGQELDVQNPIDETSYWRVAKNKSAPFYGGALRLGAVLAEADEEVTTGLERIGRLYGEIIQIHDDLNDTMAVPANPDWLQMRMPLPILFALTVEHPDQARFLELYQKTISLDNHLLEAQQILIRCGAVSYCIDQLIRRHQTAQDILNETPLANRGAVDSLLEGVVAPVWKLCETLDLRPTIPTVILEPGPE